MLPLLVGFTSSATAGIQAPTDPAKTAFDITYNGASITNGVGIYVAFRVFGDDNQPGPYHFLKWRNAQEIEEPDKWRLSLRYEDDRSEYGTKRVYFLIQNFQYDRPLKFNLGVFGDPYGTEQNSLLKSLNDRAFYIKGPEGKNTMFIVNGSMYNSVDTIYLGNLPDSRDKSPEIAFPFWKQQFKDTTSSDTVFAFSWQDQEVPAGLSSSDYGFVLVPDTKYNAMQPFLYDYTWDREEIIGVGAIYFEILDYDSDWVVLNVSLNGTIETMKYTKNDGGIIYDYYYKEIPMPRGQEFQYKAFLQDSSGILSEPIEGTLRAVGADRPKLDVNHTLLRDNYNPGEVITIEGKIDDEERVFFCWQFDDGKINKDPKPVITYTAGYESFMYPISIPDYVSMFKYHILKFWVEDDYGHRSFQDTHNFTLVSPDRPSISNAFLSDERVIFNEDHELVVFGDGTDPNTSQLITVWAQIDQNGNNNYTTFISSDRLETFAFIIPIKANSLKTGRHTLSLVLEDETGRKSKETTTLSFLIWDPNQPLPPSEIGRIIDVSAETIKGSSNALFNLRYIDTNKIQNSMTFNDEGYFAAFRVYPDTDYRTLPYETRIIKFSRFSPTKVEADNFTIEFKIETEESTGYLKPTFKVTNKNYFPKKFELGIFADSDFSGDDNNAIRLNQDQSAIIVTNEAKNIHYTIFTTGILESPPVMRYFLKNVPRDGKNQIPIDQIPFFNATYVKSLTGVNAMYGFSWTKVMNPDEEIPFAITFAAHDKVKTRPRISDETYLPSNIAVGDEIELEILVKDADQSEKMRLNISINGIKKSITYTNKGSYTHREKITITEELSPFFFYECIAEDLEEGARLYSNRIYGFVSVTKQPRITARINKQRYHNQETINLSGTFTDESSVSIFYQFVIGGEYRGRVEYLGTIATYQSQSFSYEIPFPPEVTPREQPWNIVVYSLDDLNVKSNEVQLSFYLNPYNPPKLYNAGVNKKVATIGEQLVGFAVVEDKENDSLDVFVKVDKSSKFPVKSVRRIYNTVNTGQKRPLGFFWNVPADVTPGVHDVVFIVRDSENLESAPITKRLYIQDNL